MKALKSRLIPYAWADLGAAIAIGDRLALGRAPGTLVFYGVLYLTVITSALFGGVWPAVTATLLGAAAADSRTSRWWKERNCGAARNGSGVWWR